VNIRACQTYLSSERSEESALKMDRQYYVYIMASLSRRLYVGVTNNLFRRTMEHKEGRIHGFTDRYRIRRLVDYECFQYVRWAITREKQIKGWRRSRKAALIEGVNPTWADLSELWMPGKTKKEQIPRLEPRLGMTARTDSASDRDAQAN
jgi:putative endonuclease